MTEKKPSLTKQIADVLGTPNKGEQLERIQQLLGQAQSPSIAVTVMFAQGRTSLSLVSTQDVTGDDIKFVLQQGVDEVTRQQIRAQMEEDQIEASPEEEGQMQKEIDEYLKENPDEEFVPAPGGVNKNP